MEQRFDNVANLRGGIIGWARGGFDVVRRMAVWEAVRSRSILNDLALVEGPEVLRERSCSTKQLQTDRLSGLGRGPTKRHTATAKTRLTRHAGFHNQRRIIQDRARTGTASKTP